MNATLSPSCCRNRLLRLFTPISCGILLLASDCCGHAREQGNGTDIEALLSGHSHSHDHQQGRRLQASGTRLGCGFVPPSNREKAEMAARYASWRIQNQDRRLKMQTGFSGSRQDRISIEVVFHEALLPTSFSGNLRLTNFNGVNVNGRLSNQDRNRLMDLLNFGFRDSPFEFWLNSDDSTQTFDSHLYQCGPPTTALIRNWKEEKRVGGRDVMNVFFCAVAIVIGKAEFPNLVKWNEKNDGIVMLYPNLAQAEFPNEVFNTLSHEAGHWLGLLHTFERGCQSGANDPTFSGLEEWMLVNDGVQDTPAHSWRYSHWNACLDPNNRLDTCTRNSQQGIDPVFNIMNYINDDCIEKAGEFTPGQIDRMVSIFETYRVQTSADQDFVDACFEASKIVCPCVNPRKDARSCAIAWINNNNQCVWSRGVDDSKDETFEKLERRAAKAKYRMSCQLRRRRRRRR